MMKNALFKPCAVLAVMCALLIAAAVVLVSQNEKAYAENVRAADENKTLAAKNDLLSEKNTDMEKELDSLKKESETLRKELSEAMEKESENTVYIYDNGTLKIDYPEIAGAKKNDYNMELLKISDGKRKALYNENGEKISRFGIDVSSYQGKIDWKKVADDGVEFAFIRAGYRGYETGAMVEDKYFRKNIEEAAANGLDTGAYFFSQAITEEEAAEEAEYLLKIIEESGAKITLSVVYDWEFPSDEDPARTDDVTGDIQTLCAKAFCERMKEAGYDTMYYSTVNTALFRYDMGMLDGFGLWIAEYCERTQFTYDYRMWQYSCSGVIDGIDALTDLNLLIEEYS